MHQVKFDNYVALYGFLRSVTLIFSLAFFYQLMLIQVEHEIATYPWITAIAIIAGIVVIVAIAILLMIAGRRKTEDESKEAKCRFAERVLMVGVFLSVVYGVLFFIFIQPYDSEIAEIVQLLCMLIASYISYLGFTKFYRRFTLENFMALLTCEIPGNSDNSIRIKTDEPLNITIDHPSSVLAELYRSFFPKSKE